MVLVEIRDAHGDSPVRGPASSIILTLEPRSASVSGERSWLSGCLFFDIMRWPTIGERRHCVPIVD